MRFQREEWSKTLPELRPLFAHLWDDVALDKDRFVAECAEDKYGQLETNGVLHLVVARTEEGKIAGYHLSFVNENGHYQGAGLMAFTDMYFVKPEFRKANIGLQLFSAVEESLRAVGVVKIYSSHKLHKDRSAMMKVLGYKPTDLIYTKVIA